ncbi:rab gdp dissociation inhibitor, putative [Ichthyophthirius multifiliis]|uniref:Rab GDP dissociation inhibitor n=1 Tax=Ichthyophthirius multifiliis TaxID=5932 RepID=G0QX42_ICHMU|nr:rab gdp dissociation inhibitor, putative [Ichthyophthirius multifiliis]EGR30219.1 rab gdp dissociation inhibitor, putative [Ichthyophthirius multifiliis]|eukprot:XP_004031815.1 rab gdp dissociation inhibitor, putative [Ichthyophthirius multifiliis]
MDDSYDVVVCGTGFIECILSGLLSLEGKKVLHIDRNGFYGGEGASVNLTNMWKLFRPNQEVPKQFGQNRDWNIDLVPKYIISNGKLVKILLKTRVASYLEWKSIDGTYVYQMKKGGLLSSGGPKIEKVPATDKEALSSDLMGIFEKRRCKNFFVYVANYNVKDSQTYKGLNLYSMTMQQLLEYFELESNTIDFIGHAVALFPNDSFLKRPAIETVEKIKLYMDSIGRYGDSPFIYPIYGLGGIPEGFSRMSAIQGGTFMLNTDIEQILYDESGKVCGVKSGDQIAKCKMVVCDPSYAIKTGNQHKVKQIGKIIRCICITDHPIPGTKDVPSVQIIIPQRQINRQNDIYVMMVSGVHNVCLKGYYIAIVSTIVETSNPQQEIQPALDLIGPVKEMFVTVSNQYVAADDGVKDQVFVSNCFDPSSHFEPETELVLSMFKKITGKDIDLENLPEEQEQ